MAWAVGDFEYVEDFTQRKYNGKQLPVRVYTTRGLKEQGRFGLENARLIVDYYSEVSNESYQRTVIILRYQIQDIWHRLSAAKGRSSRCSRVCK